MTTQVHHSLVIPSSHDNPQPTVSSCLHHGAVGDARFFLKLPASGRVEALVFIHEAPY